MNYDKGYFNSPEFREILKKYEQASRQESIPYFGIDELVDLFSYFMSTDKVYEGENILAITKRLHPNSPESIKMEIRLSLNRGEAQEAMQLFSTLGYTEENENRLLKAEILLSLKDFKHARDIAIELLSDAHNGGVSENAYEALEILLDCGFAHEALFICEELLRKAPKQRSLIEVKAECLIELQRINEAVKIYNELIDEEPYNTFYWEQLGHIFYMVKRYGKALECFEYEIAINEEIDYAKLMQAYSFYRLRDYRHAMKIFNELGSNHPDSTTSLFYIALSHYYMGDKETAKELFTTITQLVQEGTIEMMLARVNKAIVLDEMGEKERADEAMAMAILMHPDNMKQLILCEGHLYELRDKENLTFDDMNLLEAKEWTEGEELYKMGEHLLKHNHLILAERTFRYARIFHNDDPSDVDAYLAYIHWCMSDNKEISRDIEESVESAIKGRSHIIFELFGMPYNRDMTSNEFLRAIKEEQ